MRGEKCEFVQAFTPLYAGAPCMDIVVQADDGRIRSGFPVGMLVDLLHPRFKGMGVGEGGARFLHGGAVKEVVCFCFAVRVGRCEADLMAGDVAGGKAGSRGEGRFILPFGPRDELAGCGRYAGQRREDAEGGGEV